MKSKEELLEGLNEEQLQAVLHRGSDSLILAGAGAGKTRVLTTKIAYLITQGIAPFQIMALTFTNKAASEMRERIATLVGDQMASWITMGTFHSIFARKLRTYADRIGYSSNFTIYDTTDSKALIKIILKDLELDEKQYKPNVIQSLISSAKNDGISPNELFDQPEGARFYASKEMPMTDKVFREYEDRCKRANAMDFDDLLLNMYRLLKRDDDVRAAFHERYKHILVDEYQDTNRVQDRIVKLLRADDAEVAVAGDDAQSIYSFRGAVIDNIINFGQNFTDTKLFKLTKNYRSTGCIVKAANSLIEKNRYRIPKTIEAVAGEGKKLLLFKTEIAPMEAQMVAAQIYKLIENGAFPDEIAILYRTNAQSRLFEQHLGMFNINYRIFGGLSFFDRKEVKDILAYLRLVINPNDDEAFRRVYNVPTRGFGATTFNGLSLVANEKQLPLMSVAKNSMMLQGTVKGGGINRIKEFAALIDELRDLKEDQEPTEYLKTVIHLTRITEQYNDGSVESQARLENIQELISTLNDYIQAKKDEFGEIPTIEEFVGEMSLYTDRDQEDDGSPKVTLMTMHASKGLEYEYVFCVGLEEGLIPSERSLSEAEIEEERRLLYVAITRAKKFCTLSYARERMLHGNTQMASPSRFLQDFDITFIDDSAGVIRKPRGQQSYGTRMEISSNNYGEAPKRRVTRIIRNKSAGYNGSSNQSTSPTPSNINLENDLKVGDMVYHDHFGRGEILNFSDSVSGTKAAIKFDDGSTRQLILKFAKLRKE